MEERRLETTIDAVAGELTALEERVVAELEELKKKVSEKEKALRRLRLSRSALVGRTDKRKAERRSFRREELQEHLNEILRERGPLPLEELVEELKSRAAAADVSATGLHQKTKGALRRSETFEQGNDGKWLLATSFGEATVADQSDVGDERFVSGTT